MIQDIINLSIILGMAGMNGHIALISKSGMFTRKNIPLIALGFMAGPGAIAAAALMSNPMKERFIIGIASGILATIIITLAATIGPKIFDLINLTILKITGCLALMLVALSIVGLKIPSLSPLLVMLTGIIFAVIWRFIK